MQIQGFLAKQGALKSFELIEDGKTEAGTRRRIYRATYENMKFRFTFVLTNEGKIDAIGLIPE